MVRMTIHGIFCRITMLQLPRYQPQFAWLERYINKRYPGQEAASLLHFPFHSLCFYLTTAFSPFHPLCMRVYVSWWYSSPGPRISPFLSLPLNSLRLLSYFLERKTSTRIEHTVSASIVSTSHFFDIYLSFVRLFYFFVSLFFFLFHS